MTIIEILQRALDLNQELKMEYGLSADQSQERRLIVVRIDPQGEEFDVLEFGTKTTKTFRVDRVRVVESPEGHRAENSESRARFESRVNSEKAREDSIVAAVQDRHGCPQSVMVQPVKGNLQGVPHTFYSYKTSRTKSTLIVCCASDLAAAQRIGRLYDYWLGDEPTGRVWRLVGVFIKARFWWPHWVNYQRRMAAEAKVLRGDLPLLNEMDRTERKKNAPARWDLYHESKVRPGSDEDEGEFTNRPRLFEAKPMPLEQMFDALKDLPAEAISEYITCFTENVRKLSPPYDLISTDARVALESAGLLVPAKDHLEEAGPYLLKREIKAGTSLLARAPAGLEWDEYLDFRACYVQMLKMTQEALSGYLKPSARPYLTLRSSA